MPLVRRLASTTTALALTTSALILGAAGAQATGTAHGAGHARAASCSQSRLPLPDPTCTPGAYNPDVTQDNIDSTICQSGWTKTVRPPASYTNKLKIQQIAEYGYSDTNPADYEEDHYVPLELGGAPRDPKNLWPEPRQGDESAGSKDKVENALKKAVCARKATLDAARSAIATDWTTALSKLGL